jgi:hypothetical protein
MECMLIVSTCVCLCAVALPAMHVNLRHLQASLGVLIRGIVAHANE